MGGHLNVNHLLFLGHGALWTIGLSLIALIGGGIVGFVIALARISPLRSVRLLSAAYVQLVQGTPLLVILFLGYFGLAAIGLEDVAACRRQRFAHPLCRRLSRRDLARLDPVGATSRNGKRRRAWR